MHTGAPSHPFATTQRIVEKAFGRPLSSMFDQFEEEPVASGSIAQVRERGGRNREWRGGREMREKEGWTDGGRERGATKSKVWIPLPSGENAQG